MDQEYRSRLDQSIRNFIVRAAKLYGFHPRRLLFFARTMLYQKKAAKLRAQELQNGLTVPPFMIYSVTRKCNLNCAGCYSHAREEKPGEDLSSGRLMEIISEARGLGVAYILLAGGEPLTRSADLFAAAKACPDVVFPLFTNGLLINSETVGALARLPNLIPVISVEGNALHTDRRRGNGVSEKLRPAFEGLKKRKILFGVSITVTRENLPTLQDENTIRFWLSEGARFIVFVDYVPMSAGTESSELSTEERETFRSRLSDYRKKYRALFISFPGDEAAFGGCLSSGRGFIHLGSDGRLEPCPFAPVTDSSAAEMPLKEAMKSRLLAALREHASELEETSGGCALWKKREWLKEMSLSVSPGEASPRTCG